MPEAATNRRRPLQCLLASSRYPLVQVLGLVRIAEGKIQALREFEDDVGLVVSPVNLELYLGDS